MKILKRLAIGLVAAAAICAGPPAQAGYEPTSSIKTPDGTSDCVIQTTSVTADGYVTLDFHNLCELTFSIRFETVTGASGSNGIEPLGDSHLTIRVADFVGFSWWFK